MNLLDRFSTHLKDALARAIQLAAELKNAEVTPLHLWFTLSHQKGSVAMEILGRFSISPKLTEEALLGLPMVRQEGTPPPAAAPAAAQATLAPLSAATKTAMERALIIAHDHKHNYIGSEHLLSALLELNDRLINQVLTAAGVAVEDIKKQVSVVLNNAAYFPQLTDVAEVVERLEEHARDHAPPPPLSSPEPAKPEAKKKESALDWFANNLSDPEVQKNIDPVIGREREMERVIQILCRRTKNNPLLLGDPGVGKTAIAEGLAKRILEGKVPEPLLNKKIYALDLGLLIAGTIYRGEFEARLRQVIDEVTRNPNIILFIDEIHNLVGAGNTQGAMDAANMLKPALARGQIHCIGATTPGEYKKYLEADAALERRFQPIWTQEPSVEDTIKILSGIKANYESYHHVAILPEAIDAAARLADRYISNKFLPDKAIDLLDETAAAKRLAAKMPPAAAKRWRLEQKLEQTVQAKEQAARSDRLEEAVALKQAETELREQLRLINSQAKNGPTKTLGTVTATDVARQVAKVTGTSPSELLLTEHEQLERLEERIKERVIGQDDVVHELVSIIRQAELGLGNPERPLASLLFVGPSGVGKTELAKVLASLLYPDKNAFIKLDMSEFSEGFGVSKLLGSPAGYVGFKEANQFTDKIKMHPYCVILFDEIDKAHADVIKLLLQMLEEGDISDAVGKKISLKHAIIILTTTWGAEEVAKGALGFGHKELALPEINRRLMEKLKERFSPEVINRLDKICLFKELGSAELVKIASLEVGRLNDRLKEYHTAVAPDETVFQWVVKHLPERQAGAREIRRYLRGELENLLSKLILERRVKPIYHLAVSGEKLAIE